MLASTRILRNVALGAAALGVDVERALSLASLHIPAEEPGDPEEQRMPVEDLDRIWAALVEVSGDPAIGVRIGALARLDHYGVLGSVARASATLGDALLKTGRYIRLWVESSSLTLIVEGDEAQMVHRSLRTVPPTAVDCVLAQLNKLAGELTGRDLYPTRVRLAHPRPADTSAYVEVFGVEPLFDEFDYALTFPVDVLMLPIATHDTERTAELFSRVHELVGAFSPDAPLTRKVREVLEAELRGGNPMIENVAAQLGIHPKTLTRRLKQEGTSHSELLDALRRTLAERYLSTPSMNVTGAAFLLGFSDASAFNKAFRRWFGVTPSAFRTRR